MVRYQLGGYQTMPSGHMKSRCRSCSVEQKSNLPRSRASWLGMVMMLVLPKCPFCVLAYSSTLVMCGRDMTATSIRHHQSPLTIAFSALLCLTVLFSIVLNNRDSRTIWSFFTALIGSVVVMVSSLYSGGEILYYSGVILVFLGVWMNGSLLYVLRRVSVFFRRPALVRT